MRSTDSALVAEHGTEADTLTRYRQVLRQRLLLIGVLVLAILASVILDFTLGPAGLPLDTLWQTLLHPASGGRRDAGDRLGHPSAVRADGGGGRPDARPGRCGNANHPQ